MKKLIAMGAALALLGGVTVANAQSSSTPGAGSAGQDQRGADKAGDVKQGPAQKSEKDAPPSTATTGAGPTGAPMLTTLDVLYSFRCSQHRFLIAIDD